MNQAFRFEDRHNGPDEREVKHMLGQLGFQSPGELIDAVIPSQIRSSRKLELNSATEEEALEEIKALLSENKIYRSYIGMGYYDTLTPAVIQRNILENPGWYTQYTPYQAEISQGRLEALLNYQTLVSDLTGLEISNSSLLDEATAAAEAMTLCYSVQNLKAEDEKRFYVSKQCHPQTIEVVRARAEPMGIKVVVGEHTEFDFKTEPGFGVLVQYPATDGTVEDYHSFVERAHQGGALVVMAADLLSLCVLKSPGELGADVAVGSTQRFGVPMGYGGPHAAFFSTRDQYKRRVPGRIVGVSKDRDGRPGIRLALQTREQHIRRDKATSNICTAQVLLAIMASMYAVYHGPRGLRAIAEGTHDKTRRLAGALKNAGVEVLSDTFFDTLRLRPQASAAEVISRSEKARINLRDFGDGTLGVSLDEAVTEADLFVLFEVVTGQTHSSEEALPSDSSFELPGEMKRQSPYLEHPVFNSYQTETEMLRYIKRLEVKDLSLTASMIPLGSCTMKLNATSEMIPVTWPEVSRIHPFVPASQAQGYRKMISHLEGMLESCTGFDAISMQPNAGSQGEYAGLLVIRAYHQSRGEGHRNICLIPQSAHGTNPASAVMAGMKVVVVACDQDGNIDLADLQKKSEEHAKNLAALMVTYPSTHGVFESQIRQVCETIHAHGGQVYMDGANFNAQIGYCYPAEFGADVMHLNLHKTFCIPHGGGGPGMGPIGVREHLRPFLPGHPVVEGVGGKNAIPAISAAPWGSPSILPISWMYIRMMGAEGLTRATEKAILNANYIAQKLDPHYPVLYRGEKGYVAHECIVDVRPIKAACGVDVEDIAKRLMDYGFHAPTVSFPVAGTLMIEPTESENLRELDRFCEAMISIRKEIEKIEKGEWDAKNNPLKNAPHPASDLTREEWDRPYSRAEAVYPSRFTREEYKFWPPVARIDSVGGDRNLICSCPPIDAYESSPS